MVFILFSVVFTLFWSALHLVYTLLHLKSILDSLRLYIMHLHRQNMLVMVYVNYLSDSVTLLAIVYNQ